ncbi:dihydroxyacetone kinase subunit DhaL [Sansalvadorimonas sp. 2012CJ34-2]|uniref:Dihydroxyacetone kinase subunit DhaL n=1 Tax=Parendozoicomonas callyspongiae TaxID=2942213 RepID=A0ABT0PIM3_9GAMM|nr:dihydroxyacetone kinase subunit DhaL [Sansalvadorimonas sp. 2012CJ34-2]MCL6271250.1 dihydroxyacetone kinase subunit DhaL [Sansalvadorimonas sp. 2012CJ34-2]
MSVVTKQHIVSWLQELATELKENREYLTKLDSDIGDADHGLNMNRGFEKVMEKLPMYENKCLGTIFKQTGMTLLSSVGGASGPLYGTFFLKAATSLNGKEEASIQELIAAMDDGVGGIVSRGRTKPEDKTMCDVWWPTMEAMHHAADHDKDLSEVIDLALHTAEEAMRATIPMQARKGRASYLGERSIGHQDPGATSSMLMIKALKKTLA